MSRLLEGVYTRLLGLQQDAGWSDLTFMLVSPTQTSRGAAGDTHMSTRGSIYRLAWHWCMSSHSSQSAFCTSWSRSCHHCGSTSCSPSRTCLPRRSRYGKTILSPTMIVCTACGNCSERVLGWIFAQLLINMNELHSHGARVSRNPFLL